jgi:hypothetical protein
MGLSWARQNTAQKERRRAERYPLACPASFRTISNVRECRLENISEDGAKLVLSAPPKEGISGMLGINGQEYFCTIIWANADACGVEFERPLRLETILELTGAQDNSGAHIARTNNIQMGRKRSGRLVSTVQPQTNFFSKRQACSKGSV